ncbi:hypothetical protein EV401DRAFT_951950 [Pisolithus croceorrhizus]|nr:hypothetical protein EV401DRAFT_951950 [Pisolithus croceorrhizus]
MEACILFNTNIISCVLLSCGWWSWLAFVYTLFHASARALFLTADTFMFYVLYQGSPLFCSFRFTTASSCWPCEEYKEEQEEEKLPRSERSVLLILMARFSFLLNLACPTPRVPATLLIYSAPFGGDSCAARRWWLI